MERELKKVKLNLAMSDGTTRVMMDAHTTAVAGLVIAPLRELVWRKREQVIVKRKSNWCIWTYPTGLCALRGFPTKKQAIEFAETRLTQYSWIGLLADDIRNTNDMEAMSKDFVNYRKEILEMRQATGL